MVWAFMMTSSLPRDKCSGGQGATLLDLSFSFCQKIIITECPQSFPPHIYYTQELNLPSAVLLFWARSSSYLFWLLLLLILCHIDDTYEWEKNGYDSPRKSWVVSVWKWFLSKKSWLTDSLGSKQPQFTSHPKQRESHGLLLFQLNWVGILVFMAELLISS